MYSAVLPPRDKRLFDADLTGRRQPVDGVMLKTRPTNRRGLVGQRVRLVLWCRLHKAAQMVVQAVVVMKIAVADKQDALREIRRCRRLVTKNPNHQGKILGEMHGEPFLRFL
ncbi:hypothetical protein [Limnohabitans sp. Rim8]|uniref:hypothetical protein n=1 Tax=Limnohabitans sp. Rim8 TaxID=1100718 RepID=UPI0025D83E4B|nr:hypothetical protein [Limnohabitans sp. Rim8]